MAKLQLSKEIVSFHLSFFCSTNGYVYNYQMYMIVYEIIKKRRNLQTAYT